MRLLGISGSLRAASTNTAALRAAALLAPAGCAIVLCDALAQLPPFNPDRDGVDLPPPVAAFRAAIAAADGLLIAAPEYAHGVSGVLKNALDWLVAGAEFPEKPVALINASPRATLAQPQLRETLLTMAGRVIDEAAVTLPLLGRDLDAAAIAADPALAMPLRAALDRLIAAIVAGRHGADDRLPPDDRLLGSG